MARRDKHFNLFIGSALAEYIAIGGTLFLACIAVYALLGSDIKALWGALGSELAQNQLSTSLDRPGQSPTMTTSSAAPAEFTLLSPNELASVNMLPEQTTSSIPDDTVTAELVTLTLSDGSVLSLPAYMLDVSVTLEAAGSEGVTRALTRQLEVVANQLDAQHRVSLKGIKVLKALVAQGYRIADVEHLIEDRIAQHPTRHYLTKKPITYGGTDYDNLQELVVETIGSKTFDNGQVSYGEVMQTFYDLHGQAAATGVLSDPVVKTVVDSLAKQIIQTANSLQEEIYQSVVKDRYPASKIREKQLKKVAHINTLGVCAPESKHNMKGIQCR